MIALRAALTPISARPVVVLSAATDLPHMNLGKEREILRCAPDDRSGVKGVVR